MKEQTESDRIVNRHMARLLAGLEEAGCPLIFREAVKSALVWMRDDLKAKDEQNEMVSTLPR